MDAVPISEIKSRLSEYLKKVRSGETVLILDRGRPVARIDPAVVADDPLGQVVALVREGLVRPAQTPVPLKLLKAKIPELRELRDDAGAKLLDALIDERREGR